MEQKTSWSKAFDYLKVVVPPAIRKFAPQIADILKAQSIKLGEKLLKGWATKAVGRLILKVVGMSGGFYTYFVTRFLRKTWDIAKDYLKEKAYFESVMNKAEEQLPKLEENKKDIPLNEKVKNESDFLNGDGTR